MFKNLTLLAFNLLYLINRIIEKFLKRSMFDYFKDFLETKRYKKKSINKIEAIFFVPNYLTKWRVSTLYTKEPDTLNWINNFQGKDIIFWDIGANIGLYSVYGSLVHKNISIFSFEPSTSNLRILSRNISINNLHNKISILPLALNNQSNKFLDLKESKFIEGGALNSFDVDFDSNGNPFVPQNTYKTLGTSIDSLIENKVLEIPDYIKLDVDGIEHLILEGGLNTLKNSKIKSLLVEVNEDFNIQKERVISIMQECNYTLLSKEMSPLFSLAKVYNYIFINNN